MLVASCAILTFHLADYLFVNFQHCRGHKFSGVLRLFDTRSNTLLKPLMDTVKEQTLLNKALRNNYSGLNMTGTLQGKSISWDAGYSLCSCCLVLLLVLDIIISLLP